MPTSVDIKNLKINKLTEAQYDAAVQGGVIGENELSVLTDAELEQIQVSALPTASADELGNIYQYVGATDANYTNGYFYKCEGAGDPVVYSWAQVNVQPAPSGLPDQTGQSGKFLTTNGTDASWSDKPLVNDVTNAQQRCLNILGNLYSLNASYFVSLGSGSRADNYGIAIGVNAFGLEKSVAIGYQAIAQNGQVNIGYEAGRRSVSGGNTIAIGERAQVNQTAGIQLGGSSTQDMVNNSLGTFYVCPDGINNYKLLESNGYIPAERLKNAATAPATMPTLAVADWSSNTQTVSVTGVTASNIVIVSPAPASAADYAAAGIVCTAQAAGELTFTCTTVPSNAITVNVIIMG